MDQNQPRVNILILDAGPLLSLSPLRGLSKEYYTVPQVLGELKDEKAKNHFENLGLSAGVRVEVRSPDAVAVAKATLAAKKSGDFSVLSTADLHVVALTYALHQEQLSRKNLEDTPNTRDPDHNENGDGDKEKSVKGADNKGSVVDEVARLTDDAGDLEQGQENSIEETGAVGEDPEIEELAEEFQRLPLEAEQEQIRKEQEEPETPVARTSPPEPIYDDPSDEEDNQGEWITPGNVALHKSQALDLLPDSRNSGNGKGKKRKAPQDDRVDVGCMTADYAMQNVLLHMGLNLVGVEGKRITSVKNWVLRCHACFKICKDSSKKFCPSCGNASLLRTTISTTASKTPGGPPTVQIHLKNNFQYRNRGTKYSIPMPKPGTSKTGSGTGIILREDQQEFMRAVDKEEKREKREYDKLMKAVQSDADGKGGGGSVKMGDWTDPDWMPDMLIGAGKKRVGSGYGNGSGLPTIGMGRKNPNEKRRRK